MINYEKNGEIVINGFEKGIGDSMMNGLGDMRNTQIISVPEEVSVSFGTSQISPIGGSGTVSSANSGTKVITYSGTIASGDAVTFSAQSGLNVVVGTVYWIVVTGGGTAQLYSDYSLLTLVSVTNGTGTFSSVVMGRPKYFSYAISAGAYFMLDNLGQVWSNMVTELADNPPNAWRYTGNSGGTGNTIGNGMGIYNPSNYVTNGVVYLFVFRNSRIDYATITTNTSIVWTYGWNPATGATGSTADTLKAPNVLGYSHETLVAPDNAFYYCDTNWIGRFFENTNKVFNPTDTTTYTYDQTRLLPFTDSCQCLAFLGTSVMIGGMNNVIYPWDTTSPTFAFPLLLPEYNIQKMVTVNTNTFIFVGNRGRIYYTNGTNAQLYKKIPDFISNTIEPYFTWGGACSTKNQLYFSASVATNAGVALTSYGGVWAIDLDSKAIRMTNTLSYQTTVYNGYASALIPNFGTNPNGTGLFIGWDNGSSVFGIDTTVSAPYAGATAVAQGSIDSDLVPIGTFLKPTTNGRVEFKLSKALVAGESVQLFYRQQFSAAFVAVGPAISTANTDFNGYSWAYQNVNFQNSQWIQIRAVLISTATNPSYCRLYEMRLGQ